MKGIDVRKWWNHVRTAAAATLALGLVGGIVSSAAAMPQRDTSDIAVYALTTSDELLTFEQDRPDRILVRVNISGLADGEDMLGIDIRPATGTLYGVSSASQIYTIDPTTGAATAVGAPFAIALDFESAIGIDFNPTVDRLRIVTDNGQNLRANPDTGALADGDPNTPGLQPDSALAYAAKDRNVGKTPNVVAAAYTQNFSGTTTTTLYDIDSSLDILATQLPPNAGTLNTVGRLRINAGDLVGFDIFTDEDGDNARAAIKRSGSSASVFYTIDLTSGRARSKGTIGSSESVRDIAISLPTS